MKNEPVWSSEYFGGLHAVKLAIAERLEQAGAKLGTGSLSHAKISRVDANPPPSLSITAVPFNAPRFTVVFEAGDFLRSTVAIDPQAAAKVDKFVAAFRSFREDPARYLHTAELRSPRMRKRSVESRAVSSAQTHGALTEGHPLLPSLRPAPRTGRPV